MVPEPAASVEMCGGEPRDRKSDLLLIRLIREPALEPEVGEKVLF
jgi:hypothetical protein